MGQKVNPNGIRIGIVKTWDAKWYADKDFADNLHEDIKIRKYLKEQLGAAGVSKIETERSKNRLKLTIHTAKPGMVIGRGGSGIEQIKDGLKGKTEKNVDINIAEIRQPDLDATLVAENIAQQLERRIAFRRAMKQSVGRTMRLGAKGIKVKVSGRGNREKRGLPRRQHPAAHAACRHRLRHGGSPHDVWTHRRQGLDLHGRNPSREEAVAEGCR